MVALDLEPRPLRRLRTDLVAAEELGSLGRIAASCIGADPGVQHGLAAAVLLEGGREVRILRASTIGQRTVRSPKALAAPALAPSYPEVFAEILSLCSLLADVCAVRTTLACEDWFIGPNGAMVRDTARQVYYAQAAAEQLGLRFRPVMHSTWKLHAIGTGGMKSADAARAYGRAAADLCGPLSPFARWCPANGASPSDADDAAAACIAHWYLSTEASA
jgi:hypothetical protein